MFEVYLNAVFQRLWAGHDPFQAAFELTGESFRKVKSRHTLRIELEKHGYFVKLHRGCGWGEAVKNWLQFKQPVTDAGQEYRALRHLEKVGVDTMTPCAYGCCGFPSMNRTSFLITEELTDVVSLEEFCAAWQKQPPSCEVKRALCVRLGEMTGKMHRSGLNHRDCYLCHFLLRKETANTPNPRLHVIDLHRAQIRRVVPERYRIKDLGGLWFSAMDAGLTKHDLLRFLCAYFQENPRQILTVHAGLLRKIDRTARTLYCKEHQREPSVPRFE